nr:NADH dehydrogenase [ubiquinone] 1 alpha subcomplex assembly factor 3 [Columba livia]
MWHLVTVATLAQVATSTTQHARPGSGSPGSAVTPTGAVGERLGGLPRSVPSVSPQVGSYKDITHDSLSLFRLLEPRIEILVLGTGDRVERLPPAVLKQMRVCGIAVEVQDTPNACATFNFLTSEKRMAAAGLIPPRGTYTGALPLPA